MADSDDTVSQLNSSSDDGSNDHDDEQTIMGEDVKKDDMVNKDLELNKKKNNTKNTLRKPCNQYPIHKTRTNNPNLALQIFSHIQTQRKLEKEKRNIVARTERKCQKLKQGAFKVASLDISPKNRFGGYWTQCRLEKAHNMALDARADSCSIHDGNSTSNFYLKHQQEKNDKGNNDFNQRRISIPSATHESIPNSPRRSELPDFPLRRDDMGRHSGLSSAVSRTKQCYVHHEQLPATQVLSMPPKPNMYPANKTRSFENPFCQGPNLDKFKSLFIEHDHQPGQNTPRAKSAAKSVDKRPHIINGPGKVKINFSTLPVLSSNDNARLDQCFEWGSMQAGALTLQARLGEITLDGHMM